MQLNIEKTITKKELNSVLVSKWRKPKGYDLSFTDISCPSMKLTLNVMFGKYDEFKRFMKNMHDFDTVHQACTAMCVMCKKDGTAWHYILIQENDWTADHYNTLVHELHHFIHFALDDKGVSYGMGGEEVFAYLQGYFMEMVVRAFIELKKVTPKKK